ncbi:MAG: hypothetical protein LBT64_00345 [Puniceicoccales bacterium]|jgi:DNA polymerase-3 subunit delta|nr:hypothetical protein [Puniceicoccales bacterium]
MAINSKSVTFVNGSDDFLVDRRARVLYDSICGGCGEIFHLDDANNFGETIGHVILSLGTIAMFESSNTIWLRSVCFLGGSAIAEGDRRAIDDLLENIGSASADRRIIISAAPVDRRTKWYKSLLQLASVIDLDDDGNSSSAESTIEALAKECGVGIDADAAPLLHMKCGNNFRLIEQEINKISTNIFGKRSNISSEDVETLVDDHDSGNFFDPVEKFFEGNIAATLRAIDKYFFCNGDARPLLSAFQSRNRLLIQLQSLLQSKRIKITGGAIAKNDIACAARALHMDSSEKSTFNVFSQNPWYLSKLVRPCANFQLRRLLLFQTLFAAALLEITERCQEQKYILKNLAVKCLSRSAP